MYLNVILTIFVIVQITICGCVIYWWKKYGKKMVKSFSDMNSMLSKTGGNESMDLSKFMSDINNMGKMFGGLK
jgi:hypothetical protein